VLGPDLFLLGASNGPAGSAAGIMRSEDGGANWTQITTDGVSGPPLVGSNGTIYWVLQNGSMAMSTDRGATWTAPTLPGTLRSQNVVELADGRLASLSSEFVVVSSDNGFSWQAIGSPMPTADPGPSGLAYNALHDAIYVWTWDCTDRVPQNAVARLSLAPPG